MSQAAILKELIRAEELLVVPGAYDAMTAKVIEKTGFPALYITGSGISFSLLGHPDVNTVSYAEFRDRVAAITDLVSIPVIADIDTGYGGVLNLIRLIRDFERLGVAAVQIEDQQAPKKCGHCMGRQVVSVPEMKQRIRTIVENRSSDDSLLIIGRTDSRSTLGIDEAIDRANEYLSAGADVAFVESPESEEEILRIGQEVHGPVLFNNIEGGRSPNVSKEFLQKAGFAMSIFPGTQARCMLKTTLDVMNYLKENGSTKGIEDRFLTHSQYFDLFDFDQFAALEQKYLG